MSEVDFLHPIDDEAGYLPVNDVLRRIRARFDWCRIDRTEAQLAAIAAIAISYAYYVRKQGEHQKHPAADLSFLERLCQDVLNGYAVHLHLVQPNDDAPDDEDQILSFTVSAGTPISLGYDSRRHEELTAPLRDALADCLGYRIERGQSHESLPF